MSEQALIATPSGASSTTGSAVTGTFSVLPGGKTDPTIGKLLPTHTVERAEKPDLEEIAQALNKVSRSVGRDLRFEVDLERGKAVLQVIDRETGDIIRQIPHESAAQALRQSGPASIRLLDAVV